MSFQTLRVASSLGDPTNSAEYDRGLLPLLAFAGLLSSFTAICLDYPAGGHGLQLLPGVVFGAMISAGFGFRGYLHSFWATIGIVVSSVVSYYVAVQAAFAVELYSPFGGIPTHEDGTISKVALFVGGSAGGFLLLVPVFLLVCRVVSWRRVLFAALCWSFVGGILGVVGWALGPSLGMALWSMVHSQVLRPPTETFRNAQGHISHAYSLYVLWQTGMGLLFGYICAWRGTKASGGDGSKTRAGGTDT